MSVATALASVLGMTVEELFGPLGDPAAASLFRQVNAGRLAKLLLDCEAGEELMTWALPTAAYAASEGMSATQFTAERATALLTLGSAVEGLRANGWALNVQTRTDLARDLHNVELFVTIEADYIPQHAREGE